MSTSLTPSQNQPVESTGVSTTGVSTMKNETSSPIVDSALRAISKAVEEIPQKGLSGTLNENLKALDRAMAEDPISMIRGAFQLGAGLSTMNRDHIMRGLMATVKGIAGGAAIGLMQDGLKAAERAKTVGADGSAFGKDQQTDGVDQNAVNSPRIEKTGANKEIAHAH